MKASTVEKLFKKYAQPVQLTSGIYPYHGTSYAFIQPLRYKNKMYVDAQFHPTGIDDDGRFIYIGLPNDLIVSCYNNDRYIEVNGMGFSVIRAENVFYKERVLYVWAILKKDMSDWYV